MNHGGLIAGRLAERLFGLVANPHRVLRRLLSVVNAPFELRLKYDAISRPSYGYGVYHAALQARSLGIPRICAIELGVGPGGGLIALEHIAGEIGSITGIEIDVLGFDTGTGMPPPMDYRDLPYRWAEGEFRMEPELLRGKLSRAELILGNVRDTIRVVLDRQDLGPIGFVSFDLDYYSSTRDALVLFDAPHFRLLPRIFCHVDDIIGDDRELHCRFVGELLAIDEFNQSHTHRKMSPIFGLAYKRAVRAWWNDSMHVLHVLDHPLYDHLLPDWNFHHHEADRKLASLRDRQARERESWRASATRPA